jgi:hypothetical protein
MLQTRGRMKDDTYQQHLCHKLETGLERRSSGKTRLFKAELIVKTADMTFVTRMLVAFNHRRAFFIETMCLGEKLIRNDEISNARELIKCDLLGVGHRLRSAPCVKNFDTVLTKPRYQAAAALCRPDVSLMPP